ncbi:MAG: hypothetical protein LC789_03465 [Actinobacteria bacterium]|nr:hypothetical protein [Actinomycetota bacterium]MCA1721405.1 hypothetical protein [Actinomycetota bacterium]
MNRRSVLPGVLLTVLLSAGPALADVGYDMNGKQEGADPGKGLSVLETLGLFLLLPALILLVIGGLAWVQGGRRGSRYRPARGWDASPVWFAGPPNATEAVASVGADGAVLAGKGGASGSW